MHACSHPIEALLKHRAPMLLLDEVVGYDASGIVASVVIRRGNLFATPKGVPGHVALEYMAQACGAYAGAVALDAGEQVRIGFLLGTRMCRVAMPWFPLGARLMISATVVYHDEQMAAFDCKIEVDGRLGAEAQLKVYQPDDEMLQRIEVE